MKAREEVRYILMDIMSGSCDGLASKIEVDYNNFSIETGFKMSTKLTDYEMIDMILDSYCEDLVFWEFGLIPEDLLPIFEENYHPIGNFYCGIMGMTSIDKDCNCTYKELDEIMEDFQSGYDFYLKLMGGKK